MKPKHLILPIVALLAACNLADTIAAFGTRGDYTGVTGCYALFAGQQPVDTSYYNATHLVRLDSTVSWTFERNGKLFHLRTLRRLDPAGRELDAAGDRGSRFFTWWADSLTDTLRISFVDGFSGAALALARVPGTDTLRGRIEEHWDVGPPFVTSQGPAHAVRVPCR